MMPRQWPPLVVRLTLAILLVAGGALDRVARASPAPAKGGPARCCCKGCGSCRGGAGCCCCKAGVRCAADEPRASAGEGVRPTRAADAVAHSDPAKGPRPASSPCCPLCPNCPACSPAKILCCLAAHPTLDSAPCVGQCAAELPLLYPPPPPTELLQPPRA